MSGMAYTVSDYLLDRLAELGVDRVFGVPGDYTLGRLDHVTRHGRLSGTGCTNELNAGCAADGYGRLRGIAALCTTFGVGELSALNAVTGSFAEHVPVVHIVGAPSTGTQAARRIVHHSLGDGVFTHFLDMHASITCARAAVAAADAPAQIDRVLSRVRDAHLPGYLLLPADVGELPVEPPQTPLPPSTDLTDPVALDAFTEAADRLLDAAGDLEAMSVLAGLLVHRLGATRQLRALLDAGPLRHATSLWAKSVVDESHPCYLDIHAGAASEPVVRSAIEEAAVPVVAGVQFTDLNSGFFTHQLPRARTIELAAGMASVGAATFAPIALPAALDRLTTLVEQRRRTPALAPRSCPPRLPSCDRVLAADTPLTQAGLWCTVAEHLRPGDIVLADQGTAFYGMGTQRLPPNVTFLGQPLWASIGYTLPALLGACAACPGRRGVLLIGDGAAQMTVQELSGVLRAGLRATVIVVDNDGYTVERAIHGPTAPYNDIAGWEWTRLPAVFAPGAEARAYRACTVGELAAALGTAARAAAGLTLIQAVLPRLDVPELLATLAQAASRANGRAA